MRRFFGRSLQCYSDEGHLCSSQTGYVQILIAKHFLLLNDMFFLHAQNSLVAFLCEIYLCWFQKYLNSFVAYYLLIEDTFYTFFHSKTNGVCKLLHSNTNNEWYSDLRERNQEKKTKTGNKWQNKSMWHCCHGNQVRIWLWRILYGVMEYWI